MLRPEIAVWLERLLKASDTPDELSVWEKEIDGQTLAYWVSMWAMLRPYTLKAQQLGYTVTGEEVQNLVKELTAEHGSPCKRVRHCSDGSVVESFTWEGMEPLVVQRVAPYRSAHPAMVGAPDLWKQLEEAPEETTLIADTVELLAGMQLPELPPMSDPGYMQVVNMRKSIKDARKEIELRKVAVETARDSKAFNGTPPPRFVAREQVDHAARMAGDYGPGDDEDFPPPGTEPQFVDRAELNCWCCGSHAVMNIDDAMKEALGKCKTCLVSDLQWVKNLNTGHVTNPGLAKRPKLKRGQKWEAEACWPKKRGDGLTKNPKRGQVLVVGMYLGGQAVVCECLETSKRFVLDKRGFLRLTHEPEIANEPQHS